MKKIISLILVSIMLISCLAMVVSAKNLETDSQSVEGQEITCVNFLDFNGDNNDWALYDSDSSAWSINEDADNQFDENQDWAPTVAFVSQSKNFGWPRYGKDKLNWALTDSGEVLHLEVASATSVPGFTFVLDEDKMWIPSGYEDKGRTEYCKIRIRNYSSADQFTLGYINSNINGGQSFFTQTITDVPVTSNSGEWVTYTFSMPDYNAATNYEDSLPKSADGAPTSRWSNYLTTILLFPFGYNVTDGSGAYVGAAIDIDYVVFGSKNYCEKYKSALELKEEAVKSIAIKTEPTKKEYYVGDTIDLTGLVLEATYNDGTKELLDSANVTYNFDNASDSSTVTLKYGAASASYNVKVGGITGVEVIIDEETYTSTYDKVSIENGFSPKGLTFKVNHADGTFAEVSLNAVKLEYDFSELGENVVTVNYHGETCTFLVDIINVVSIKVDDIDGVIYGQEITSDNLNITCVYSDGTEKKLADANINATVEVECDTKNVGTIDMKVSVSNVTYDIACETTAKATMATPKALVLNTDYIQKEYDVDASLNTDGLVVSYQYDDDKLVAIDSEHYRIRCDLSSPGSKVATVTDTINGLSATFDVTVKGEVVTPTTKNTETTKSSTSDPTGTNSTVIIIIIVAVVVVAAVVVVVIIVSKKKKSAK